MSNVRRWVRLAGGSMVRLTVVMVLAGAILYGLGVLSFLVFGCWICENNAIDVDPIQPTAAVVYAGEVVELVGPDDQEWNDRIMLRVDRHIAIDEQVRAPETEGTIVIRTGTNAARWFSVGNELAAFTSERHNGDIDASYIHDLASDQPFRGSDDRSNYVTSDVRDLAWFERTLDCLAEHYETTATEHPRFEALVASAGHGDFAICVDETAVAG